MAADGGFAVVWTRLLEDRRLYLRLFDSDGAPVSGEIRVDTLDPADCAQPDVDIGVDGEITVVWTSMFGGRTSILGRTAFGPDGALIAEPFILENRGRVWLPTAPTVAAAGASSRRLLGRDRHQRHPAWNPDRRQIALGDLPRRLRLGRPLLLVRIGAVRPPRP